MGPLALFMPSLRMAPFGESLSSVLAATPSEAGVPAIDSTYGAYLIATFFGLMYVVFLNRISLATDM